MEEEKTKSTEMDPKELIYIEARSKKYSAEGDLELLLAGELFKSLGDYKDSEMMAKLCFDSAARKKKNRLIREDIPRKLLIISIPIVMILTGLLVWHLNK